MAIVQLQPILLLKSVQMDTKVLIEIIKIIPSLAWIAFLAILIIIFYEP